MKIRYRYRLICALLLLLPMLHPVLSAQYASISGVVNSYTPVTAVDQCPGTLTVQNAGAFKAGDTVLIIQMKGAAINTSNTASFGSIEGYGGAGNYEFGIIAAISGNTIALRNKLLQAYDPAGVVQLVRVPHYRNASVDGVLAAQPWNGTTGGVLAIDVADTLRLNANIDLSGAGFRGGIISEPHVTRTATNYFYTMASGLGGQKGEGITAHATEYEAGRGALANGGGGGNDHNAGGGGGSNIGAGGQGGKQYSAFGQEDIGGLGGYPLNYPASFGKVFMGGGGGGGHRNEHMGTAGTNGGGIILIRAKALTGNARTIAANGIDLIDTAGYDGAGGGGGGGAVFLQVATLSGPLTIETKGGKGGDNNDDFRDDCVGTGGGGGGGVVWVGTPLVPAGILTDVRGGVAGLIVNPSPCFGTTYGADSGRSGSVLTSLVMPQSNLPVGAVPANAGADRTICEGERAVLGATGGVSYSWSPATGLSCIDCPNPVASPAATTVYIVTVTDSAGCIGRDSVTVRVITCSDSTADLNFYFPFICIGRSDRVRVGFYNVLGTDTAVAVTFSGRRKDEYTLDTALPRVLTPTRTVYFPVIHRAVTPGRDTTIMNIVGSTGRTYRIRLIDTVGEAITPVFNLSGLHLGYSGPSFDTCITITNNYYVRVLLDDINWMPAGGPFELTSPSLPHYLPPGGSTQLCFRVRNATPTSTATLYLAGNAFDSCRVPLCVYQTITVDTKSGDPTVGVDRQDDYSAAGLAMSVQPNPFSGNAEFRFRLPARRAVRATLVDMLGREAAILADREMEAGEHRIAIDGALLESGQYFIVVRQAGETGVLPVTLRR